MASEVDICNMALRRCGDAKITSLADDNKRAKLCNEAYAIVRDKMLQKHPWNFAKARVELAITANTPEFGYDNEFQLPADVLWVVTYQDAALVEIDYVIESGKLLSNEPSFKVEYVKKETNTALYSPLFVEALALELAVELSYALVQSNTLKGELKDEARRSLSEAKLRDAQEGSPNKFLKQDWTDDRDVY